MSRNRLRQAIAFATMAAVVTLSVSCGTAQPTSTFFTTDTVTGTVADGAPGVNPVSTTQLGPINIGLISLLPTTDAQVTIAIGTLGANGVSCTPVAGQTVSVGGSFVFTGVQPGNYCLEIIEATPLTEPNTYIVKFSHH